MSKPARETPLKDRRPRGVFWLCVLCALALVTAVGMSIWVPRLQRRRALDEISRLGGTVYVQAPPRHWGERLLRELGGSSSRPVLAIDFSSSRLNDDNLSLLNEFPAVRFLTLAGADLSDEGIRRLRNLEHLQRLVLVDCPQISDAAERDLLAANPGLQVFRRGPALLGVMGEPGGNHCRIVGVRSGTAAQRGGVLLGDVITAIDGKPIHNFESLARHLSRCRPGEKIVLTIIRSGRTISLPVKLGAWERQT